VDPGRSPCRRLWAQRGRGPLGVGRWAFGTSDVAEHWDGASWHRVKLPTPTNSAAPSFWGAGAVSSDDIWAVGDVSPADAPSHAIIDDWNGRRWQLVPGPPTRSELYGVAALSAHDV
jgi:hypothetical protein